MDRELATNHDDTFSSTPADGMVPPGEDEFVPVATPNAGRRPWGPWASIGWTLLCLLSMVLVQLGVLIGFAVATRGTTPKDLMEITSSSLFLSTSTIASTPIVIGLVAILIFARGWPIREYLALRMSTGRQAILAIAGLAILLVVSDSVTYLLGRPIVPQVMVDVYQTGWFVLLLPTLVIAAPLGEETLMRGFLYQGIASSRWGSRTAVVVTSIAWASIHLQYDLYGILQVAVIGIYLGEVRRRTGSLTLAMLLHGFANAVSTIEMIILVQSRGG